MDTSWSQLVKHLEPLKDDALVLNTLKYVWDCHKLGILCTVTHEGPKIWPFSNPDFTNTSWPKKPSELRFVLDGEKIVSLKHEAFAAYYAKKKQLYKIRESIDPDMSKWWLNGHLLCNTTDAWGTRGLQCIQSTLEYLWKQGRLEDYLKRPPGASKTYAFLINRRDFPQLVKDTTKTAHIAFVPRNSDGALCIDTWPDEIEEYKGLQKCTMLSFYGSDLFDDTIWEPPEYWQANNEFLAYLYGRQGPEEPFAGQARSSVKASLSAKWPQGPKLQKAVFRGTLTGLYMDLRNVRLRLVKESLDVPHLIDAGLTAWSPRDRIWTDSDGITTVSYNGPPDWLKLVEPMSPWAQANYATIIYVPGHVASSRMYWHMECQRACGCQIQVFDDSSCVATIMKISVKI